MAFDKLVSLSVVNATKNGIEMDLAVAALKNKAIDITATQIEKQIPIELPFSTREILNGGVLPSNLLTPSVLNTAKDLTPPIPEPQRVQIVWVLDGIESALNGVIQTVNVIKGTLNTITSPLNTLETVASTLNNLVSVLENAIILVKAIPIPLGAPIGVGVPANVVTGFADVLVKTDKAIEKIKPPLEAVPDAIEIVNRILIPIVDSLNSFDPIFDKTIKIIAFIRLLLQPDPVSQADIDSTLSDITSGIQESLAVTAGPELSSSNPEANDAANNALLDLLEKGKLFHRGFTLTLEFDPNNTFSFPARRIKAVRSPQISISGEGVTLYSNPPDQGSGAVNTSSPYSFSTSIQVLVDETKFNIDQYLLQYISNTIEMEGNIIEIGGDGKVNIADFEDEEEIPPSTPLTPAQILENAVNEARQSLISRGFTEREAQWIMEKSGLLVQNVIQYFELDSNRTPNSWFRQQFINRGFTEDFIDWLLTAQGMDYIDWIEYIQPIYGNAPANDYLIELYYFARDTFGLNPYV